MRWCQEYAFQNRHHMLELMVDVVERIGKSSPDMEQAVNIHHNFCQCERCTYTVCARPKALLRALSHSCSQPLAGLPGAGEGFGPE